MGGHAQHSLSSRELEESIRAQHLNDPRLGNFLLYSKPSEYDVPCTVCWVEQRKIKLKLLQPVKEYRRFDTFVCTSPYFLWHVFRMLQFENVLLF